MADSVVVWWASRWMEPDEHKAKPLAYDNNNYKTMDGSEWVSQAQERGKRTKERTDVLETTTIGWKTPSAHSRLFGRSQSRFLSSLSKTQMCVY